METILVTGASSGIGQAIAIGLSGKFNLVLNGRNEERLRETLAQCRNQESHVVWPCDLSDLDNLESNYLLFVKEHNVQINHLVYCAGTIKTVPLRMVTADSLRELFAINVFAGELLIKQLASKRINGENLRSITLISSNISNFGAKAHSMYSASKAAVDGMMRSLAVELAPRIRVNSVLPGAIKTPMTEHIYEDTEVAERMAATYPLGLGNTNDILGAVRFLISSDARWITGQQLTVDGGRTINITG